MHTLVQPRSPAGIMGASYECLGVQGRVFVLMEAYYYYAADTTIPSFEVRWVCTGIAGIHFRRQGKLEIRLRTMACEVQKW